MKRLRSMAVAFCLISLVVVSGEVLGAQEYASMSVTPGGVVWRPLVSNGGVSLSVAGPNGVYISRAYGANASPSIGLSDAAGNSLPDGQYSYELRFAPVTGTVMRLEGQPNAAQPVAEPMVQSGSFRIAIGQFLVPSAGGEPVVSQPQATPGIETPMDQVVADDQIVQGSLCVGLDCVNNESFGFDTIRLKENNTRIKFDDTSISAGFPANDWTIVANDSASGGASYLAFEDTTGAKVPFKVIAGAPTNSLYVSSSGKVGVRTATPVLDLSFNTSDTPAIRFEQNNGGGYTAQTWDIAGNEANFFVRDVTGGSRLPFRIRPGAPTSSIDISASGYVGIGTASPAVKLTVNGLGGNESMIQARNNNNSYGARMWVKADQSGAIGLSALSSTGDAVSIAGSGPSYFNGGNVGIGVTSPAYLLDVNGQIRVQTTLYTSSRELKNNIVALNSAEAREVLEELNPVKFNYKASPGVSHIGFIAEDVPNLVAQKNRDTIDPMDIVAVLTKVVQAQNKTIEEQQNVYRDQQNTIDELKRELASLKSMVGRISSRNMVSAAYPE